MPILAIQESFSDLCSCGDNHLALFALMTLTPWRKASSVPPTNCGWRMPCVPLITTSRMRLRNPVVVVQETGSDTRRSCSASDHDP